MFSTLESRQTNSALALNAFKVQKAIEANKNAHAWAALFILSSAVTTIDYLGGAVWRLPVSVITLPDFIKNEETNYPTIKEFVLSAIKAICCAIGIIIFPIIGVFKPGKALHLIEEFHLVRFPRVPVPEIRIIVAEPAPQAKKPIDKENDFIPEGYANMELVRKKDQNWNQVKNLTYCDEYIFPTRWHSDDEKFPCHLSHLKMNGTFLWKFVAKSINIPCEGRNKNDVMKDIISTIYRKTRKKTPRPKPSQPLQTVEQPQEKKFDLSGLDRPGDREDDMDLRDKLLDITPDNLESPGYDIVIKLPRDQCIFSPAYLENWHEMEYTNCLLHTRIKGTNETLCYTVAKRLGIPIDRPKEALTRKIIRTLYPTAKERAARLAGQ